MVTVLQIAIGGKTFTGVASYLYQQYLHMDRSLIHYDFLFCRENAMGLVVDDPIFQDSEFITLNAVNKNNSTDYFTLIREVRKALRKKKYDYVVVNTSITEVIYACLIASKRFKGLHFIAHAHNTGLVLKNDSLRNRLSGIFKFGENMIRGRIRSESDFLFACSEDAGKVTFGDAVIGLKNFKIIRNAIDLHSFEYDSVTRKDIRDKANTSDKEIVYGNIGSLCKRKNQLNLLDIFASIQKKENNARLWLIGDGDYKEKLIKKAKDLMISDKVVFWGQRSDVNRLIQGMDCFIFNTISEGLGIVAIEAQAAGIPTIVSDGVPKDVVLTETCKMLPLELSPDEWAAEVIRFRNQHIARSNNYLTLAKAGYDIYESSVKVMQFYCDNV